MSTTNSKEDLEGNFTMQWKTYFEQIQKLALFVCFGIICNINWHLRSLISPSQFLLDNSNGSFWPDPSPDGWTGRRVKVRRQHERAKKVSHTVLCSIFLAAYFSQVVHCQLYQTEPMRNEIFAMPSCPEALYETNKPMSC